MNIKLLFKKNVSQCLLAVSITQCNSNKSSEENQLDETVSLEILNIESDIFGNSNSSNFYEEKLEEHEDYLKHKLSIQRNREQVKICELLEKIKKRSNWRTIKAVEKEFLNLNKLNYYLDLVLVSSNYEAKNIFNEIIYNRNNLSKALFDIKKHKKNTSPSSRQEAAYVICEKIFGSNVELENINKLGKGSFGEVWDLSNNYCIKLYNDYGDLEFEKKCLDNYVKFEEANKKNANFFITANTLEEQEKSEQYHYEVDYKDGSSNRFIIFKKIEGCSVKKLIKFDKINSDKNFIKFCDFYSIYRKQTGLSHPDLGLNNVLFDKEGRFHLIDLDTFYKNKEIDQMGESLRTLRGCEGINISRKEAIVELFINNTDIDFIDDDSNNKKCKAYLLSTICPGECSLDILYHHYDDIVKDFKEFFKENIKIRKHIDRLEANLTFDPLTIIEYEILGEMREKFIKNIEKKINSCTDSIFLNSYAYLLSMVYNDIKDYDKMVTYFEMIVNSPDDKVYKNIITVNFYDMYISVLRKVNKITDYRKKKIYYRQLEVLYSIHENMKNSKDKSIELFRKRLLKKHPDIINRVSLLYKELEDLGELEIEYKKDFLFDAND